MASVNLKEETKAQNTILKNLLDHNEDSCPADPDPSGFELHLAFVTNRFLKAKNPGQDVGRYKVVGRNSLWFTEITLLNDRLYIVEL